MTTVEIKLFDVSSLVKKQIMMQKYQTLKKIFATSGYNKFTRDILEAMIKWKTLVDKSSIAEFINNAKINKKVGTLATKGELRAEQDKLSKLQASDSSYFHGKSHFEDDGIQNCLMFGLIFALKRLAVRSMFQSGNLKDCLMKALDLFLYLMAVLLCP